MAALFTMAAPTEGSMGENDGKLCEIEATIVTGFEQVAIGEVRDKLGISATSKRGMITMTIPVDEVAKINELQCTENLYVVLNHYKDFKFGDTAECCLQQLQDLVPRLDWTHGLDVWRRFFSFPHPISPNPQAAYITAKHGDGGQNRTNVEPSQESADLPKPFISSSSQENQEKQEIISNQSISSTSLPSKDCLNVSSQDSNTPAQKVHRGASNTDSTSDHAESEPPPAKVPKIFNPMLPSFRATCYRSGAKHSFQSPQAAHSFGGAMQDYFGWNVKMKDYDIEAVLIIDGNDIHVAISLNKESLHRRHIKAFGPTTLKPTIAYSMLRMCNIRAGELVVDPMCGGGTLPIEAAINWPEALHMCGDLHDLAWPRCQENVAALNEKRIRKGRNPVKIDIMAWDVCKLPLPSDSVDVFVTDLPFGKRSGSRMSNWHLYPRALAEMARVSKRESGRACLLTCDKKCIIKTLQSVSSLWRRGPVASINMGGLAGMVFLLYRTADSGEGFKLPANIPK